MRTLFAALGLALILNSCASAPKLAGQEGPAFFLTDQNGATWESQKLKQQTYLLDFWATWCEPCIASVPDLNTFQAKHASKVKLLGIAIEEKGWAKVTPFMAAHNVQYPVTVGLPSLAAAYGIEGFPTLLLVRGGKVEKQMLGRHSLEELEKELAPYLN